MKKSLLVLYMFIGIQLQAMEQPKQVPIDEQFKNLTIKTKENKRVRAAAINKTCTSSICAIGTNLYINLHNKKPIVININELPGTNKNDTIFVTAFWENNDIILLTEAGCIIFLGINTDNSACLMEIQTNLSFNSKSTNRFFNDWHDIFEECIRQCLKKKDIDLPSKSLSMYKLCKLLNWQIIDPKTTTKLSKQEIESYFSTKTRIWTGKSKKNANTSYARTKLLMNLKSTLKNERYIVSNTTKECTIISAPKEESGAVVYLKQNYTKTLHSQKGTITALAVEQYYDYYGEDKNNISYKHIYLSGDSNGCVKMSAFLKTDLYTLEYQFKKPIFALKCYSNVEKQQDILLVIFNDGSTDTITFVYEKS